MKNYKRFIALLSSFVLVAMIVFSGNPVVASAAKLSSAKMNLTVNQTSKIKISNSNKKVTYTFKSSDTNVATVTKSGSVKGVNVGSATITVKSTLKKKISFVGTVKVTVKAAAKPTAVPTAAPTAAPAQGTASHDEILKRALVSTGNNYRIKNAIEKARNGEPVTIAYIGGSITDGAMATPKELCFAYRSYEYFKKTYGKGDGSNVKFVNAGLSGTPSTLGMIRYDKDVVQVAGCKPDIVFIEFAVNDSGDPTKGEGYECLIRNIMKADNNPAVVLLFSIFQSRWNEQARLQPIGEYYKLPMVSIYDGILPLLKSGAMKNTDFFAPDGWHPINVGHQLYADCIDYMYDTIDKETKAANDVAIPDTPKIGKAFEGIQMIDSTTTSPDYTIEKGSFSGLDNNIYTSYHDGSRKSFPNNWMHTASSGKDSMKITITCKNFDVVYKNSGNANAAGKADVYVDGTKKATLDASVSGGWNQALNSVIFKDDTAVKHTIEIKMADGCDAKEFTVEAFGYTK